MYFVAILPLLSTALAAAVVGRPEGFATGTTGGGSAACIAPNDIKQLTSWLADSTVRCILIDKEFNFIGSEGKKTENGCRPASNKCGSSGQDAINGANWCNNGNAGSGSTTVTVTYDVAGRSGLTVGSNKSILGVGSKGVIRGKGLRMANGAKNVIIQNIHITDLNPQYIWGGDAITLDGTDMIWIDHVKISLIGRQMLVLGNGASGRVTVSNSEFDGRTSWSASCDGRHYWTLYLTGSNDKVTLKGNYIHHTSGRSPKVGGNTLLHAVNNYWYDNTGHAFDIGSSNGYVLAEGNVFQNVKTPLLSGSTGHLFGSPSSSANAACSIPLGHACELNAFGASGTLGGSDSSVLAKFAGSVIAGAATSNGPAIQRAAGVGIVA